MQIACNPNNGTFDSFSNVYKDSNIISSSSQLKSKYYNLFAMLLIFVICI